MLICAGIVSLLGGDRVSKPILILGAGGIVGHSLCQILLRSTAAPLRLASRSLKRSEGLCSAITGGQAWSRIQPVKCDASDRASLEKAMAGAALVVVCSATRDNVALIAEAALACDCDLLDIHWSPTQWSEARRFHNKFLQKGLVWITEGGCHPGLPGALIRWAALHLESVDSAKVSAAFSFKDASGPGSCVEFAKEVLGMKLSHMAEGEWEDIKISQAKPVKFNFGEGYGEKKCYPFHLPEVVQASQEVKELKEAGFYIAEGPWYLDKLAIPVAGLMTKLNIRLARPAGSLLKKAANLAPAKGEGAVFLLEAAGRSGGKDARLRLRLRHRDPSFFTALCVSSCICQWTAGTLPKGVQMMAMCVEPSRFIAEILSHGGESEITTQGLDHAIDL